MKKILFFAGLLIPNIIFAAVCNDVTTCVSMLLGIMNSFVPILIGVALILFIYGILKFFSAGGNESELGKSKSYMFFGIVSLAVILGVWSLVGVVSNAFFPGSKVSIPQFQYSSNN
jgi:hypothetical protein